MTTVEISTKIFNTSYLPYLGDTTPVQIYFGGSSSGKSVFLSQRCVRDILQGGRNYLVCRQVGKTIRGSVAQEIKKVIKDWGVDRLFNINKTDGTITCNNGYQIVFAGLDDVEKLKSITPAKGVFTDTWIEEATETDEATVGQLIKRQRGGREDTPKRLIMSFNPILQSHWIYSEYFATVAWADDQTFYRDDDVLILKTTYKDNRFLTKQDVKRLENEKDFYRYQVYTLGNWGILGEVIFTNWTVRNLEDPNDVYYLPEEQRTNRRNGLDFGFSSDPAAMPMIHYDKTRSRVYIYDELYERGLTNQELAVEVMVKIWQDIVTCDSAEPKSIKELCKEGINARPAKKGKDSVNFGIQWLQQQTIIIDAKCVNAKREFSTYHWKKDKDGNVLRMPVDKDNHLIDGTRYALEDDMEDTWLVS